MVVEIERLVKIWWHKSKKKMLWYLWFTSYYTFLFSLLLAGELVQHFWAAFLAGPMERFTITNHFTSTASRLSEKNGKLKKPLTSWRKSTTARFQVELSFVMLLHFPNKVPISLFTILESRDQEICEMYVVEDRRETEFWAPHLWNARSGYPNSYNTVCSMC